MSVLARYFHWLHGKWPAGAVEKLPLVRENGATNGTGVRIVGDLSGVPLLKFSSETGTQALRAILAEPDFARERGKDAAVLDVAIIGGGVSGVSAAMEAAKAGLNYTFFEATQLFLTVANFPKAKPIFTYPTEMTPAGAKNSPPAPARNTPHPALTWRRRLTVGSPHGTAIHGESAKAAFYFFP